MQFETFYLTGKRLLRCEELRKHRRLRKFLKSMKLRKLKVHKIVISSKQWLGRKPSVEMLAHCSGSPRVAAVLSYCPCWGWLFCEPGAFESACVYKSHFPHAPLRNPVNPPYTKLH